MKKERHCLTDLSQSTRTILLRHDRTEAEERFLSEILLFLERIGYSGEVHCRTILVNQKGELRRPDFYLPRYALPIEIDGRTRDGWQSRQLDTEARDLFYQNLGANMPLVIESTAVVSPLKMARLKFELEKFLRNPGNRITPRKRNTIAKQLSVGRKLLESKRPGIFDSSGSEACQFLPDIRDNGFKEDRHFGGTRFILRSKYRTKALKKMERFKVILKQQIGKVSDEIEQKICEFVLHLSAQDLDRNEHLGQIAHFADREHIDFAKLAHLIAKFAAL